MPEDINAGWKRGDPIEYMRDEVPTFDLPPYDGERYEALVPDTLDLQERAALAVNVLTEATDPDADYEMYWLTHLDKNPIVMQHDFNDHCQCKFIEALPLVRIVSGATQNEHVERKWMEVLLKQQGDDGLLYTPVKGRPWASIHGVYYMGGKPTEPYVDHFHNARILTAMMLFNRRDGGTLWADTARKIVDGLVRTAVDKGDYAYYAPTSMRYVEGETEDIGQTKRMVGAHVGFMILSLAHTYREISYEPALDLAGKLVHYLRHVLKYPDEEGRFEPGPLAHFHMHTYVLLSHTEYARQTGDKDLLEYVRKGYEYAKAHGNVLMGYFPEHLHSEELEHSELCEVADMIAIGIKLTDAGVGDYLDDVDRWVRNMFAEGQLTPAKADLLRINSQQRRTFAQEPDETVKNRWREVDPMYQCADRALERNIGAFAGWPKANDWYVGAWEGIMHCCTGNASRAIYFIWEKILTFDDGKLRVNLLLNRASPWADVDSHIPYTGRVDIRVKQDAELAVRIPEWVAPDEVKVTVSGEDRSVSFDGRYAQVGDVKAGEVVTLTFPIHVVTHTVYIEKERYDLVCKGNEIVGIWPPGTICPIFQRPHYREDTTRWRTIERFVSNEIFNW